MEDRVSFSKEKGVTIQRFTLNQRIQHFAILVTFSLCVITGLPIKYHSAAWASKIVSLFGSFDVMFYTHVVSGIVMLLAFGYHFVYLAVYAAMNGPSFGILPKWKDAVDIFETIKYNLGLSDEHPEYERYCYKEKMEYLALMWGTLIMGLSGLMMYFPEISVRYMPRWVIEVFRMAHSGEAVLAALAIVVWHFYNAHFTPDFFPMNKIFLTGKISKVEMEHEHPIELREILDEVSYADELDTEIKDPNAFKHSNNRALIGIELIVYIAILIWVLKYFIPLGL
jgi:cytochrome b subunit of formate dehydrogenase